MGRGLLHEIIEAFVAILDYLGIPDTGPVRVFFNVLMTAALLLLVYELFKHIPKKILVTVFVVALVIAYLYPKGAISWPWKPEKHPVGRLEGAFSEGQMCYSRGDYECTIKALEPLLRSKSFEAKHYHLLGLAYLSLPEPQCSDAINLLPWINQKNLEKGLKQKCNEVSCPRCAGTLL